MSPRIGRQHQAHGRGAKLSGKDISFSGTGVICLERVVGRTFEQALLRS